eukprot:459207-Pyramimonas_sp.AAC.2
MSCRWQDQGYGNRKGQFITQILRPSANGDGLDVVAETNEPLGLALHRAAFNDSVAAGTLDGGNDLVSAARPGDRMRVSVQPLQLSRCFLGSHHKWREVTSRKFTLPWACCCCRCCGSLEAAVDIGYASATSACTSTSQIEQVEGAMIYAPYEPYAKDA